MSEIKLDWGAILKVLKTDNPGERLHQYLSTVIFVDHNNKRYVASVETKSLCCFEEGLEYYVNYKVEKETDELVVIEIQSFEKINNKISNRHHGFFVCTHTHEHTGDYCFPVFFKDFDGNKYGTVMVRCEKNCKKDTLYNIVYSVGEKSANLTMIKTHAVTEMTEVKNLKRICRLVRCRKAMQADGNRTVYVLQNIDYDNKFSHKLYLGEIFADITIEEEKDYFIDFDIDGTIPPTALASVIRVHNIVSEENGLRKVRQHWSHLEYRTMAVLDLFLNQYQVATSKKDRGRINLKWTRKTIHSAFLLMSFYRTKRGVENHHRIMTNGGLVKKIDSSGLSHSELDFHRRIAYVKIWNYFLYHCVNRPLKTFILNKMQDGSIVNCDFLF